MKLHNQNGIVEEVLARFKYGPWIVPHRFCRGGYRWRHDVSRFPALGLFTEVIQTDNHLFLLFGKFDGYIIPRTCFATDQRFLDFGRLSCDFFNRAAPPARSSGIQLKRTSRHMTAMTSFTLLDSDPAVFDLVTSATGPGGKLPLTEELLREAPSGDLFGWTQNVGMGWNPAELGRHGVPDPQHAGRPARRRRHADRARLPHRPLGGRPADAGRRRGVAARSACMPFAGFCHRPVRRPHAGHDRHDRQPAVPQRRGAGASAG